MSTIQSWSTTAASNTSVDSIDIAENCSPANLNNAQRAVMANVAAFRDLTGGAATTGGSANAHTLTSGLTLLSYAQGLLIGFEAGYTNTGAVTLNVDSLGAKSIKTHAGSALPAGAITAGGIYLVAYEAGNDSFILIGGGGAAATQTASGLYGMILGTLSDRDYRIVINARRAFTITGATTRSVSGTATATFKINTTALGGTANSVSSSEQTQAHASSNSVAVGDDIVITISSSSSCVDLSFSLQITEVLLAA